MPTFPVFTSKSTRPGFFVAGGSAAPGHHALEQAVVLSGRALPAGAVVGKVTASGKLVYWTAGASDGSQNVYGVLWDDTDASEGDVRQLVVARDATVNWGELQWDVGVTGGNKTTARGQMAALGIVARDPIPA
jgi:hypothetical protein